MPEELHQALTLRNSERPTARPRQQLQVHKAGFEAGVLHVIRNSPGPSTFENHGQLHDSQTHVLAIEVVVIIRVRTEALLQTRVACSSLATFKTQGPLLHTKSAPRLHRVRWGPPRRMDGLSCSRAPAVSSVDIYTHVPCYAAAQRDAGPLHLLPRLSSLMAELALLPSLLLSREMTSTVGGLQEKQTTQALPSLCAH